MRVSLEHQPAQPRAEGDLGREGNPAATSWSGRDLAVAGLVALLSMLIAWVYRSEVVAADSWHYVMAAIEFPQDSWVPLGYTRYGMILPVLPLVLAFGHAPATFYLPAIAATAVLSASVYLVGRRAWGPIAGLIAVVLLLSNWVVFFNLTRFYPDIPSIALVMAALVLAVAARDRQLSGLRFGAALTVMAGFLLGWSFEARETALFAWPVVVVVLWVKGRVVRNAILVAVPVLFWAALDVIVSAVAYGDPLLKLHTFTHQDLSTGTVPADVAVRDQFVGLPRLDYLTMVPRLLADGNVPGGIWFLVLAALALLALLVPNTAVRLSAAAFVVSYLLFVGISGMFAPNHPAGRLDIERYWIQFVPWIALAVAGALHVVVGAILRRSRSSVRQLVLSVAAVALVAGPVAAAASAATASPELARNGGAPMAAVSIEIARRQPAPGESVFTDWRTRRVLTIYRRPFFGGAKMWSAPLRTITGTRPAKAGDLVLLVASRNTPCPFCTKALRPWREKNPRVPDGWQALYASRNRGYVLYEVR